MTTRGGYVRRCAAGLTSLGLVVGIAVAGSPTAAAADEGKRWSPPQTVNHDFGSTDGVFEYELGVTEDGTTVAVWLRHVVGEPHRLEGARRPPGGQWSQPTVISKINGVGGSGLSNVFVDGMGNVTLAVQVRTQRGIWRQEVSTWRSDGTVEPAVVLGRGLGVRVYGDSTGDLVAVARKKVFSRPFGATWHKVERLPVEYGHIAVGAGARVDAVWHEPNRIRTAALDGDTWGPVSTLADPFHVNDLSVVTNPAGDIGVIWRPWNDDDTVDDLVESVFRRAGSEEWSGVERVNRGPESVQVAADSPEIGVAADGTMIVAWRETERDHQYDTHQPILSATRAPTGAWSDPQPVGFAGQYLRVRLSVNASGDAIVLSRTEDETGDFRWLAAAHRAAGSTEWTMSQVGRKLHWLEASWNQVHGVLSDSGEAVAVHQMTADTELRSRTTSVTSAAVGLHQ